MTDSQLVSAFKETGDNAFVGELFERHATFIYGICRKYLKSDDEARDAAMEVFEYLLTELRKYEIEKFTPWLGMATRNFCLMKLRKQGSLNEKAEEFKKSEKLLVENGPEPHLMGETGKEETLQQLEAALTTLNPEQKRCLELFYLQGKSYQEVAQITGYSDLQVKSYIQNGKRNLKIRMTQSDG